MTDKQEQDTAPQSHLTGAIAAIAVERERQVAKGYDQTHDDEHRGGEIITAKWGAIARINAAIDAGRGGDSQTYRKFLTQAAAQISAEVDRVARAISTGDPE